MSKKSFVLNYFSSYQQRHCQSNNNGMLTILGILVLCSFITSGFSLLESKCPYKCILLCPNGQQVDETGCPICRCNFEKQIIPSFQLRQCPPLYGCPTLYCPYGHKADSLGCPSCQCMSNKCGVEPLCVNQCPGGYVISEFGCSTCKCKAIYSEFQQKPYCFPSICRRQCSYERLGLPSPIPLPSNCRCDCAKSRNGYHMVYKK